MRWTGLFLYLSVVAVLTLYFHSLAGWAWWVTLLLILLLVPSALVIGFMTRHEVRWSTVLSYLSVAALLGAVAAQVAGSTSARDWCLLVWSVLLLAVAIGLSAHPMRGPAWGVFVGFWGVVGVLWLIVIQALAVGGVLEGASYTGWSSWPLALIGIWFFVASATGYGARPFGPIVDSLGLVAGFALIAIAVTTWADLPELRRGAGLLAAASYSIWVAGLGWVFWAMERPVRTAGSLSHAVGSTANA